jgi:hypothetical protein
MDRFLSGLKPDLQHEINLQEPEDFSTMVKMEHKFDAMLFSMRQRNSQNRGTERYTSERFDRRNYGYNQQSTPMELGVIQHGTQRPGTSRQHAQQYRPKLTDADKERLRSEGRCFYCKEQGHIAFRCPKKPGNEKRAGKAPVQ